MGVVNFVIVKNFEKWLLIFLCCNQESAVYMCYGHIKKIGWTNDLFLTIRLRQTISHKRKLSHVSSIYPTFCHI